MNTILITNKVEIAKHAQFSGVKIIMIDLETIGKKERQNNVDTFISDHKLSDLKGIRDCLIDSKMLVRINPINKNSKKEIDSILKYSPDYIMLPMLKTVDEVKFFLKCINGRSRAVLLFETIGSIGNVDDILNCKGIDLAYIGLNDLSLELKMDFLFEILSGGIVDYFSKKFKKNKIKFGFGGISRIDTGILDSKLILSEHVRVGSQFVILSRSFHDKSKSLSDIKNKLNLKLEINKINDLYKIYSNSDLSLLDENKLKLVSKVNKIIA